MLDPKELTPQQAASILLERKQAREDLVPLPPEFLCPVRRRWKRMRMPESR